MNWFKWAWWNFKHRHTYVLIPTNSGWRCAVCGSVFKGGK